MYVADKIGANVSFPLFKIGLNHEKTHTWYTQRTLGRMDGCCRVTFDSLKYYK